MRLRFFTLALIVLLVAACSLTATQAVPTALSLPTPPTPTAEPTLSPTPAPTQTPNPSPTPDPYDKYTIGYMRSRTYGGGEVQVLQTSAQNSTFTRYIIQYPSDGLTIGGFMDVPNGTGPFPVIIALHGYVNPSVYKTLDYTTRYADALARAGYFVLHPNLRSFPPSDSGDDLFRTGMATDALNLIGIVKQTGGKPGPLLAADPARIGMWGHSMGGGVTTRVLTVSPDIKAAVLYSAVSGDEAQNYAMLARWSNDQRGSEERAVPAQELQRISPMYYYNDVTAAVSINQGLADAVVPPEWSKQTCAQLQALGKTVECHYYEGQPHNFQGQGDRQFIQSSIQFFDQYLR